MSRLDALVTALPKILPVVENITDDDFRLLVFHTLVEVATADTLTGERMPAGPAGAVLTVDPNSRAGVTWKLHNAIGLSDNSQVRLEDAARSESMPAVFVNEQGSRLPGTFEPAPDGSGGTFTPAPNSNPVTGALYGSTYQAPTIVDDPIRPADSDALASGPRAADWYQRNAAHGAAAQSPDQGQPSETPAYDDVARGHQRP